MSEYKKEMKGYLDGMEIGVESLELEIKYLARQKENLEKQLEFKQESLLIKKKQQAFGIKRFNEIKE